MSQRFITDGWRKSNEQYPEIFPSKYSVEWLIRHRKQKGYADCFVRPGKVWLCNVARFAQRLSEKAAEA